MTPSTNTHLEPYDKLKWTAASYGIVESSKVPRTGLCNNNLGSLYCSCFPSLVAGGAAEAYAVTKLKHQQASS